MRGRPDYGKESPEYAVGLTDTLSYLTDEELAWITNPRDGLATVCKFLPTPADVHEFLRARREKAEQFKPAHTTWRKIEDDPNAPWNRETDAERKRRVVKELLGYNPMERGVTASPRSFEPPSAEDMRNLKLKSPADGPSRELIAQLEAEGWPFIPTQQEKAA